MSCAPPIAPFPTPAGDRPRRRLAWLPTVLVRGRDTLGQALVALVACASARLLGRRRRSDAGQATTEYALVLLGAAMVALLLVAWATSGGGAGRIGRLLDSVLDAITSKI